MVWCLVPMSLEALRCRRSVEVKCIRCVGRLSSLDLDCAKPATPFEGARKKDSCRDVMRQSFAEHLGIELAVKYQKRLTT